MKLKDIQEAFDTNISHINYEDIFDPPDHTFKNWSSNELGRGTFSTVKRDVNDPHLIDKEQRVKQVYDLTDLFDDYAEIIAKERLWELIHFPRVYSIKTYRDQKGEKRSNWKMEKLIPIDKISKEEIKRLTQRYFIPSIIEEIAEKDYDYSEFSYHLDIPVSMDNLSSIKDSTLRTALEKLTEIYTDLARKYGETDVELDLHEDNIMFRRTQHGLEVVFSDPFLLLSDPI
jgi:hypothetical protein